jgi:hypothetical protein
LADEGHLTAALLLNFIRMAFDAIFMWDLLDFDPDRV